MTKAPVCLALAALLGTAVSQSIALYKNGLCSGEPLVTQSVAGCFEMANYLGAVVGVPVGFDKLLTVNGKLECSSTGESASLNFYASIPLAVAAGLATSAEECPKGDGTWSSSSPNFYRSNDFSLYGSLSCKSVTIGPYSVGIFTSPAYSFSVKLSCPLPSSGLSGGAIAGIIIAIIVLALIGVGVAWKMGKLSLSCIGVANPAATNAAKGDLPSSAIAPPQNAAANMVTRAPANVTATVPTAAAAPSGGFCTKCGTRFAAGTLFCTGCGNATGKAASSV